jgi:hypothetical protein
MCVNRGIAPCILNLGIGWKWAVSFTFRLPHPEGRDHRFSFNPLNAELNPICYLLALLGAHHFFHVSRIRVNRRLDVPQSQRSLLTLYSEYDWLQSWIYFNVVSIMYRFPKVLGSNVCSEIRYEIYHGFLIASGKMCCLRTLSVTEIIQHLGWMDCWVDWWMIHGWIVGRLSMEHWVEWYWHRDIEVF